ncbi:hypothetical protein ACJMK2_029107 [Sinanodonta woodiana]|uniref:protein-tyrosine-phosphatase n=1 Tax=Sinanodonta woodiana TaxID=1069815 RepID=A0ABD3X9L6_SINWO
MKRLCKDLPETPRCLYMTPLNTTSVQVFWQTRNTSGATYFQISHNGPGNPFNISRESACSKSAIICSHIITNLEPGKTYDVNIFASSDDVQSDKCSLEATTVPDTPICLDMTSLNTTSVQVFWQISNTSGATYFQISHDSSGNPFNISKESACSQYTNLCTNVITDLDPARTYVVHIFAYAYGIRSDKCSLEATTVPEAPVCLNVTSVSPSSILVYWRINDLGGATYFQVSYNGTEIPSNVSRDSACGPNSTICSLAISNLEPGKKYDIQIFASAYGIQSAECLLAGNTIPEAPMCLNVTTLSPTALQVYWLVNYTGSAAYVLIIHNGFATYDDVSSVNACSQNSTLCNQTITELRPGTTYSIEIYTFAHGSENSQSCSLLGTTMPNAPECSQVRTLSTSSLQVSWVIDVSGGATDFQINVGDRIETVPKTVICGASSIYHVCEYTITGLNPGKAYDITIYAVTNGVHNNNPCFLKGSTMPEQPTCLHVTSLSPTSLQVQWQAHYTGGANSFHISHNGSANDITASRDSACSSSSTLCSVNITALRPGTTYNVAVRAFSYGIQNNQSCALAGTTVPNAPNCSHVSAVNTSALQVNWYKDIVGGGTDFVIHLNSGVYNFTVSNETACSTSSLCSYTINGLMPASEHDIKIFASTHGVLNTDACVLFGITMPEAPICLNVTSISPTALQVYWQVNYTGGPTYFLITHDGSAAYTNVSRENACSPTSIFCKQNITDLQPGRTYDINIFTSAYGVQNIHSCSLLGTTMPSNPECSQVKTFNTSALQVFWRIHVTGGATEFKIKVGVQNETVAMSDICNASTFSAFYFCHYTVTGLHPGSVYDIAIFSSANGIQNDKFCSLHGTTMPEAPTCLNVTALSPSALQIQWQITHEGGATYFYISHLGSGSYINISRDSACPLSGTLCSVNVTTLFGPGRRYNIAVSAFSYGIQNDQTCSLLGTTMPNPPHCSHVSAVNTSALQVHWYKDFVGGGTDFVLQFDGSMHNYTVSKETACSSSYCSYIFTGLAPGTEHDITIFASAYGILNNMACTLYGITMPNEPTCLNATALNTSAVRVFWLKPEGATNFQIKLDTEYTYANVSSTIACLSSSVCSRIITDLTPGLRHIFNIFASSRDVQNSQSCSLTGTAVPSEPIRFQTIQRTPHNFTVSWEDGSGYRDFYRVVYNCSSPNEPSQSWKDYKDLSPTVKTYTSIYLEPGTQCEIKVYAVVITGILSSPLRSSVSTTESAPGPVSYFNISEAAATYMKINWLAPSIRNGIIRGYTLSVRENHRYSVEQPACVKHLNLSKQLGGQKHQMCQDIITWTDNASCSTDVSPACRSLLLHNLKPYVTYSIGIKAYTICSGHEILLNATTLATAPPYPSRTPTQSTAHVSDRTRQIAIDLPLSDFLCNTVFGFPESWGVIVSHYSKATDDPFRGNTSDFLTKLDLKYTSWRDIKDHDNFPPYRATHDAWRPTESCVTAARNKRSTKTQNGPDRVSYIIGEDGDCSGTGQRFCNGFLKQNTEYSFRVYVCTSGGCTESFWSPPIKTDKDSSSLIIALSVISSSLLLFCITVVAILRMRKMLCFKDYKIEDTRTFTYDTPFGMGGSKLKIHRPIKLSELKNHVDTMHKDSNVGFSTEYKFLKEIEPKHSTEAAESQACRSKNRYTNILPYDHSRVKLLPIEDEEGSDYINANYIQGYNSKREYIAAQGPLPSTRDDFWRMVWEQSAEIIVMLTKCTEKGRVKCDKYWPDVNEPVFHGELIVNVSSESTLGDYIIRVIQLRLAQITKKVYHFSFLNWPDMGCPKAPAALLNFVTSVRTYVKPNFQSPIVVHCSAGVGRTGTFIAIDHLMQQVRDYDEVDIFNLVYEMRNQRCNMVQTEDQYVYIHDSILEYITEDDDGEEEEGIYINKDADHNNIYENTAYIQE